MRIVSLIPEATEILTAIGLGAKIITLPPEDARAPDRLAGILRATHPTVIFTLETGEGGGVSRATVRRVVSGLRPRPAVFALEPRSLGEILSDVKTVGDAVGRQGPARALIEALRTRIDAVSLRAARALAESAPRRIVCLECADPPVAAGWWLAELVGLAGGLDALDGVGRPSRAVTWDEVQAAGPDLVICPGPELAPSHQSPPLHPGPGAVDLLERLAALILPASPHRA